MFDQLLDVARELHSEVLEIYWILLVPVVLLLITFEFFKGQKENIDVFDILRRVVISMFLLFSFDYTINIIGMVGDGIVGKINKITDIWEVLKNLGPNYKESSSGLFNLRGHILYVFALFSYIVAYLGFFMVEALTHFVWVILYVISPLMILSYVPKATANITSNLYKGLVKVVVWKILWTILGVLLLELAMNPHVGDIEDYLLSILMNLCIGLSMLFVPIAARSLINDGLENAAWAIAAAPTMAAATMMKLYTKKAIGQGAAKTWETGKFAVKGLSPVIGNRMTGLNKQIEPKNNIINRNEANKRNNHNNKQQYSKMNQNNNKQQYSKTNQDNNKWRKKK